MTKEQREDIARKVVEMLERVEAGGRELVKLWDINVVLQTLGLDLTIKHPSAPEYPTVLDLNWIGFDALARAANDGRGPASGFERDPANEARYMRCIEASGRAWDETAAREYAPPSPEPDTIPL